MFDLFTEPLVLEIPTAEREQVWRRSQGDGSSPQSCWNTYLNRLCLSAFIDWFREELPGQAIVWPFPAALPDFWDCINGTAIRFGDRRLVVVPSENIDTDELSVMQEWIDIPEWAADYYVALQVNSDEGWVRLQGYTTHAQIKASASYDAAERLYRLDDWHLTTDLNVLFASQHFGVQELTRAPVTPLPQIELAQAHALIARLGDPQHVLTPRLAVPFALWGALISHGGWFRQLHERRLGIEESWSVRQWIEGGIPAMAQALGWRRSGDTALVGSRSAQTATDGSTVMSQFLETSLNRSLVIGDLPYELRISPKWQSGSTGEQAWSFTLRALTLVGKIPAGFRLRLLSEDLQPLPASEDIAETDVDDLIVEVTAAPGDSVVWQIEPSPANANLEILQF